MGSYHIIACALTWVANILPLIPDAAGNIVHLAKAISAPLRACLCKARGL